jgi:hypothetical protein
MRKLLEVQDAKELMNEAMEWSTFKWLFEKPRVRQTADRANAALDRLDRAVKAQWSDEVKAIYKEFTEKTKAAARRPGKIEQQPESADPQISALVERVAEADHAAHRARMDAEDTFDEAERQMSTSLARDGCKKAVRSWELHEKAIRRAEALAGANPKEE